MEGDIEWNVINEGQLLDAMVGHKPVGVNKYFQMAFICDKFSTSLHRDVDSKKIWRHLETMYNLEALDESESIPFPNNEREFSLPDIEFGTLLTKKDERSIARDSPKLAKDLRKEDKVTNKNAKDNTTRRDSKDAKETKIPLVKKELKKETEKIIKPVKSRNSLPVTKEEKLKSKGEDSPKPTKRPTRGSLKPSDDSGSNGKSSPVNVNNAKRRRI